MTAAPAARRLIEDVIAEAEETAAQMQRMVIRLTNYTDRLETLRAADRGGASDDD